MIEPLADDNFLQQAVESKLSARGMRGKKIVKKRFANIVSNKKNRKE